MNKRRESNLHRLKWAWVYGFSARKFRILQSFLPHCQLKQTSDLTKVSLGETIFIWGAEVLPTTLVEQQIHVIRVEDGFLRSVGLGAALYEPMSWVFDEQGIYFDSRTASDLELILNHHEFDDLQLQRARQIRERIVAQRLSKYNLNNQKTVNFPQVRGQRKILAIGQVEGDASIRCGSPRVQRNQDFLVQVREQKPQGYIVYRPHPDVSQGWRKDSLDQVQAQQSVDFICNEGDIIDWLEWADEVHVMTSLTGFEALLRHKVVYCYGLPFYSGWGLTHDRIASPRIKRMLNINQLIAGTLILYPHYRSLIDPQHCNISVEQALDELAQLKQHKQKNGWIWLQPFLKFFNLRRDV